MKQALLDRDSIETHDLQIFSLTEVTNNGFISKLIQQQCASSLKESLHKCASARCSSILKTEKSFKEIVCMCANER